MGWHSCGCYWQSLAMPVLLLAPCVLLDSSGDALLLRLVNALVQSLRLPLLSRM